jgi:hypothetical protein
MGNISMPVALVVKKSIHIYQSLNMRTKDNVGGTGNRCKDADNVDHK